MTVPLRDLLEATRYKPDVRRATLELMGITEDQHRALLADAGYSPDGQTLAGAPPSWTDDRHQPNDHQHDQGDPATDRAARIASAAERIRIREAARQLVDAETAQHLDLPTLVRLDRFLAVPDDPVTHLVAGLWPIGGRVVLAAQKKAGKTTLVGNLARALADGDPFLSQFQTGRVARIVLVDNELDKDMLRRWLRDQGIANQHRVELLSLRGRLSTFNILDPEVRQRWAEEVGPADVLFFDCLRPALDALGLSEDKEAGRFLEALDELTTTAGVSATLVVHHMGHSNERARGDSRILDWPDAIWKLVSDADEADQPSEGPRRRYFSALGRDVDQPETQLSFDRDTRRLSVVGGSRVEERTTLVLDLVVDFLAENPGVSQRSVERGVTAQSQLVRSALRVGVERGLIARQKAGQAMIHTLVVTDETLTASTASDCVPDAKTRPLRNCVPASIDADADAGTVETQSARGTQTQCQICGEPMTQVEPDQTTHPGCHPKDYP